MVRAGTILEEKRVREKTKAFDVAIIGAGYAGLACAMVLGRHQVSTLLFDWGTTRNATTKRIHGYLGFENASPSSLIHRARRNLRKFDSVTSVRAKVTGLRKARGGSHFVLRADRRSYHARYVLISTGVRDVKPEIEGFEKFDGDGAWHCPYCDGHEAAGKRLAVIVSGDRPMAYVKEFLGWTDDIIAFPYNVRIARKEVEQAAALGIRVVRDRITKISGLTGNRPKTLAGRRSRYTADVLFYRLGYRAQNCLAEGVGCALRKGFVRVDHTQETSVPGVYAAGDVDTDRHLVALAAASGSRAAMAIYESLLSDAIKSRMKSLKSG